MSKSEPLIFISYRRADTLAWTVRLSKHFGTRFGAESVFRDADSIEAGADFGHELLRALQKCNLMLVMIGPTWLTSTDNLGRRRVDDPLDYVRMEIELALGRGITLIPLLNANAVDTPQGCCTRNLRSWGSEQLHLREGSESEGLVFIS